MYQSTYSQDYKWQHARSASVGQASGQGYSEMPSSKARNQHNLVTSPSKVELMFSPSPKKKGSQQDFQGLQQQQQNSQLQSRGQSQAQQKRRDTHMRQTDLGCSRAATAGQLQHSLSMDAALARALHEQELQQLKHDELSLLYPDLQDFDPMRDTMMTRRLEKAPSVKVTIPRVNSVRQPPPAAVVNESRSRLKCRLELFDLHEREVKGDGACQFRSLSDQLYGTQDHHGVVRQAVVAALQAAPKRYSPYVPDSFEQYCTDMAKQSTWGDHVTLQAAADVYGTRITVVTSYNENCVLHIEPEVRKSDRVLWLSFWAEVHYNSLYPREEPPSHSGDAPKVLGSKRLGRLLS